MARPRRANGTATLVFGIVLTVVGAGLLVQKVAHIDVWRHLWRLWPVLLIIMGIKILLDYYCGRRPAPGDSDENP